MTNLLNSIIKNQNLPLANQDSDFSFTVETKGKVKPLHDKAVLLPSSIIGSPVEWAKDTGKDVLNIGKAVRGKANDYELGRINDLALKLGSLGIAGYLFFKNPFKLSKTMEVVGFGSFFASMALWPKLAIQLPIMLRTGVDIDQEYIDSQGRKKKLYQDNQYIPDLLPREDLDEIGEKLDVNKELPDRDSFIKQRAQKTALQANTLWMMTAGFATPVMTALMCNTLEKVIKPNLEQLDLDKTQKALKNCFENSKPVDFDKCEEFTNFSKWLDSYKDKTVDDKMIDKISNELTAVLGSSKDEFVKNAIVDDVFKLSQETLNIEFLEKFFGKEEFASIKPDKMQKINEILNSDNTVEAKIKSLTEVLASCQIKFGDCKGKKIQLGFRPKNRIESNKMKNIKLLLNEQMSWKMQNNKKVGEVKEELETFYKTLFQYSKNKAVLFEYIDARVAAKPGTYVANQWERISNSIFNSLNLDSAFSTTELKKIADGDNELIYKKLNELVKDKERFSKTIAEFMTSMDEVENMLNNSSETGLLHNVEEFSSKKLDLDSQMGKSARSTIDNIMNANEKVIANDVLGAKSSLYRVLMAMLAEKRFTDGSLEKELKENLIKAGKKADGDTVQKLLKNCREIILNTTTVDYIEKFQTKSFENMDKTEQKVMVETLFNKNKNANIVEKILKESSIAPEIQERMVKNFNQYMTEHWNNVVEYKNTIRPDYESRTINKDGNPTNDGIKRNNTVGKKINEYFIDLAKSKYNSKKWTLLFSGIMAGLTAITVGIGFTFGRKSKAEEQAEQEISYAA